MAKKANFIDRHVQTDESHVEWKTNNEIFQSTLNHSVAKLKRQNFLLKSKYKSNDELIEDEEAEEDDYSTEDEDEQTNKHLKFEKTKNKNNEILIEKFSVKHNFDLNENDPDDVQKNFFFGISADEKVWGI